MTFKPIFSPAALDDLESCDGKIAHRITKKVHEYCSMPNPFVFAKVLTGHMAGLYRFRVGKYRVIFEIDAQGEVTVLMILRIKHRRESYR
ncbi:type II toxin-antitoxin system RelE/ParE family toxin [Candidatus Uhrbacteria bacterium]|nr:type II toxin-antitoxin system RelE/ParE family toxin [Candidatus Uhrbacteria bacterium]